MRHVEVFGEVHRRLTVRKPLPSSNKKLLSSASVPKRVHSSSDASDEVTLTRHSDTEEDGVRKRRRDLEMKGKGPFEVNRVTDFSSTGLLGLKEMGRGGDSSDVSEDERPEKKRKLQVSSLFNFSEACNPSNLLSPSLEKLLLFLFSQPLPPPLLPFLRNLLLVLVPHRLHQSAIYLLVVFQKMSSPMALPFIMEQVGALGEVLGGEEIMVVWLSRFQRP